MRRRTIGSDWRFGRSQHCSSPKLPMNSMPCKKPLGRTSSRAGLSNRCMWTRSVTSTGRSCVTGGARRPLSTVASVRHWPRSLGGANRDPRDGLKKCRMRQRISRWHGSLNEGQNRKLRRYSVNSNSTNLPLKWRSSETCPRRRTSKRSNGCWPRWSRAATRRCAASANIARVWRGNCVKARAG